jgi:hypothetical protein
VVREVVNEQPSLFEDSPTPPVPGTERDYMPPVRAADLIVIPSYPTKRCEWCNEDKPIGEFGRMRRAEDGRQAICRTCFARNLRVNHNIENAPPKRRWSPYDVIGGILSDIEAALRQGDLTRAQETIDHAREQLKL